LLLGDIAKTARKGSPKSMRNKSYSTTWLLGFQGREKFKRAEVRGKKVGEGHMEKRSERPTVPREKKETFETRKKGKRKERGNPHAGVTQSARTKRARERKRT